MTKYVVAFVVVALVVVTGACGSGEFGGIVGGPGAIIPTGPSPDPAPRPFPVPAPGVSSVMTDGSGAAGPVTVNLKYVFPGPGPVKPNGPGGVLLVSWDSEVCMGLVPNPTNSGYLPGMRLVVLGSADGIRPLGPTLAVGEGPALYRVGNGQCVRVKRLPVENGGTDGTQFIYFQPGSRYLVFIATYGQNLSEEMVFDWPNGSCPSPEVIAKGPWPFPPGTPPCVLRAIFPLGYQW